MAAEQAISELPSDGRQLQNLALLAPGIDAGWNVSTAATEWTRRVKTPKARFPLAAPEADRITIWSMACR